MIILTGYQGFIGKAFERKLSHKEIVELVEQIRQFCDCASPKWAEK